MTARHSSSRIALAALVAAAFVLAVGAASGGADPGQGASRDHGHGAWFRSVCDVAGVGSAACQAEVVSDSSGDPLASGSPPSTALTPGQFHTGYNLPATAAPNGTTPTVAIVDAYNDANAESDLATFDTKYNLPTCSTANGCFTKINETGGTRYPSSNSGWALEISLDVQTVHSICQNCNILLVEANSANDGDLGQAENEAAGWPGVVAVSNSWGGNEFSGENTLDGTYFTHPGIAITVSSGDSGYGVEWPAASPTVTAVGGTTLNLNSNGSYSSESAWADGGSGCSSQEAKPGWQTDQSSCSRRTVVDVAADADPNTGAAVYDSVAYQGQAGWFQVGGTSLASPLIASVYALAGANGSNVNAAQIPYAYAASFGYGPASALHDVTTGSNGTCSPAPLCTAGVGYDGPTGVGTPNGTSAFSAGPPTPDFSLSASAQSGTVTSGTGGPANYTVTVNDLNGFTDAVSLGTGALPAGVSAGFSPSSTASSSTLTLTVANTVAAGTYTIPITGMDGSLSHSVNATLTVTPPPDFSLTVGSQVGAVNAGTAGSVSYIVTVHGTNGFGGSVTLGTTGALPTGVSVTGFSQNPTTTTSTLTLAVSASAAQGTYPITITGASTGLNRTVNATLTVGAPPPPDFAIAISPNGSTSIGSTGSTTYTVTVTSKNKFSGTVTLGVSGLPKNVSGAFSPTSITGGSGTSTLSVTSNRARRSSATFTVKGTSGSLSHTATASISVT